MSTFDDRPARARRHPGDRRFQSGDAGVTTARRGAHHPDEADLGPADDGRRSRSAGTDTATISQPARYRDEEERHYHDEEDYDSDQHDSDQHGSDQANAHPSDGENAARSLNPPADLSFDEDERPTRGWHGGADLGLLVMRLVLGGTFLAHGSQIVLGALGGPGIDGFARFLESSGYRDARILAWVTGVTELAGGGLLVLGLFTPLAAAGLVGVLANTLLLKWRGGFFLPRGIEYEVALAALATGLAFTGPGRAALDNGRSWYRHPLVSGFTCLIIAVGAAAAVYLMLRHHRPF